MPGLSRTLGAVPAPASFTPRLLPLTPARRPRARAWRCRRVPGQTPGKGEREGGRRGSRARPPPRIPRGWRRRGARPSGAPAAAGTELCPGSERLRGSLLHGELGKSGAAPPGPSSGNGEPPRPARRVMEIPLPSAMGTPSTAAARNNGDPPPPSPILEIPLPPKCPGARGFSLPCVLWW